MSSEYDKIGEKSYFQKPQQILNNIQKTTPTPNDVTFQL